MNESAAIHTSSLLIASSLVFIAVFFSYWQKLKLEKETLVSAVRAVIQLVAVGFVLDFIFGYKNPAFTTLLLLFMITNAAYNAAKRGRAIRNGMIHSFVAITAGTAITLLILSLSGIISYRPDQIIPIGGMVISNAMVAIGLCYRQLAADFSDRRDEIETKLALGAEPLAAAKSIIRHAIKTGMTPTIDSAKTLGIVSLPGMMTGLILAGTPPMEAIKYQIIVTFMLLSTTAIASFISCYLSYRSFFNHRKQLILANRK